MGTILCIFFEGRVPIWYLLTSTAECLRCLGTARKWRPTQVENLITTKGSCGKHRLVKNQRRRCESESPQGLKVDLVPFLRELEEGRVRDFSAQISTTPSQVLNVCRRSCMAKSSKRSNRMSKRYPTRQVFFSGKGRTGCDSVDTERKPLLDNIKYNNSTHSERLRLPTIWLHLSWLQWITDLLSKLPAHPELASSVPLE